MHSYFQKEHNMLLDISNKANISSMRVDGYSLAHTTCTPRSDTVRHKTKYYEYCKYIIYHYTILNITSIVNT